MSEHDVTRLQAHSRGKKVWPVFLLVLAALTGLLALLTALFPQLPFARFFSVRFPFAQLLAFPTLLGAGILLASLLASLICWYRRIAKTALAACLVWAFTGAVFLITPQGIPVAAQPQVAYAVTQRKLTVVTFNTAATLTGTDLRQLLTLWDPDITVLPETAGYELKQALTGAQFTGQVFTTRADGLTQQYSGSIAPTTVLVHKRLGAAHYVKAPATSFGTVAIEFTDPRLPTVVGLHTAPPLPGLMAQWRKDLEQIAVFGAQTQKPVVIAGDFNATLRHGALAANSRLLDSQVFCFPRPVGTWPAQAPEFLRTPIDHVFISKSLTASACQLLQIGKSDHLAYKTEIFVP